MYTILLLSFGLVVGCEFIKELAIDFHERFEYVVDQRHNCLVPVLLGDPIESRKHDRQDNGRVLLYQTHDVLVVPVIQSPLSHLQHKQRRQWSTDDTILIISWSINYE